ncbi:Aste57867_9612 [Aphanomyces stellatus]|uniref:Aste57867_9612 protein n=1 Tax=Aphanomyces stellatus TaxID=120398 RepID=A0A485KNB4_9STRA|nr:hypothetical protein As57867_009574 [Aphanomyces stellatus]VFT86491.1 Aste57867_9612 [Aphanomyces stellatus]
MTHKVVVLGNNGIGKTALEMAFAGCTKLSKYPPTFVKEKFFTGHVVVDGAASTVHAWDAQGALFVANRALFADTSGILLCFAVDDVASFEQIQRDWAPFLARCALLKGRPIVLVATKCDVADRQVSKEDARAFAATKEWPYIETSAKDMLNVVEAFQMLFQKSTVSEDEGSDVATEDTMSSTLSHGDLVPAPQISRGERGCWISCIMQ